MDTNNKDRLPTFLHPLIKTGRVSAAVLLGSILLSGIYISWWFSKDNIGNPYLYGLLFFGEIYHVIMALFFWITIWPREKPYKPNMAEATSMLPQNQVDIYITVCGEPAAVVEQTVVAAKNMRHDHKSIYILNDGYVAHKENWEEMEELAATLGVKCITRKTPGGAKAGNINNAMRMTAGEIIVVFDADMVPYPEFLEQVLPPFTDKKIGFVQTPQYYKNASTNDVARGAWEQQSFFFGPILVGKNNYNSAFLCGTNFAIRRSILTDVGGMVEDNIAEDFLTSLKIHQKGWQSYYIPNVLSEGLAPLDLLSYFKQQLRWARGSLEVLFGANPFFKLGLSFSQRIQYVSSAAFYLNGLIVFIDMTMPLFYLFFNLEPVAATTTSFALYFVPFMFMSLYAIYLASAQSITFRAISFTQASFTIHLRALISLLLRQKMGFSVTPKSAQSGNFLYLTYPHLIYALLVCIGSGVSIARNGITPSVVTNITWAWFNIILFIPFIKAAYKWESFFKKKDNGQESLAAR